MSEPIAGVDILVKVNTGTMEAPVWTSIGGQRGATLNRTGDEIDASDKTTGGWKKKQIGLLEWSIDADLVLQDSDTALSALETAFNNRQQVQVQMALPGNKEYTGMAMVSDLSIDAPHDDVTTVSCTLSGAGVLSIT